MDNTGVTNSAGPAPGKGRRLARGTMWYLVLVACAEAILWIVTVWGRVRNGSIETVGPGPPSLHIACAMAPLVAALAAFALGAVWRDPLAVIAGLLGGAAVLVLSVYVLAGIGDPFEFEAFGALSPREFLTWISAVRYPPFASSGNGPTGSAPVTGLRNWTVIAALAAAAGVVVGRRIRDLAAAGGIWLGRVIDAIRDRT